MKSKFSFGGYLPIILGVILIGLMAFFFVLVATGIIPVPELKGLPVLIILCFTIVWLFWGEARTKMIKVNIDGDAITIRRFGGLGNKQTFLLSEFDGFKTSKQVYGARGILEFLYLMKGNRKVIKISQAYHKNYEELKSFVQLKAKDLGNEPFSFVDEFKEIFI